MRLPCLLVALLLMPPARAAAPTETADKGGGVTYYGDYVPAPVHTLADLPPTVRERLLAHLRDRVGPAFASRLQFDGGEAIDLARLRVVEPDSRNYQWEVPAYELRFVFREPAAGIGRYVVELSLRKDASVIREADIPAFARSPEKLRFFPLQSAWSVAERNGIVRARATVELRYDRGHDLILWRFSQPSADDGVVITFTRVDVSAHDGAIVGAGTSKAIR